MDCACARQIVTKFEADWVAKEAVMAAGNIADQWHLTRGVVI